MAPESGIARTSVIFIGLLGVAFVSRLGVRARAALARPVPTVEILPQAGLLLERLGRSPGDLDYSVYCFQHP